jgi:type II secretory pathway pseudopilin PulG
VKWTTEIADERVAGREACPKLGLRPGTMNRRELARARQCLGVRWQSAAATPLWERRFSAKAAWRFASRRSPKPGGSADGSWIGGSALGLARAVRSGILRSSFGDGSGRHGSRQAFTLIEFIGVLAVVALLAAAIVPVAIRHIDLAAKTKEASDLQAISDALRLEILRTKTVPSDTTWASAVADWLSRSPASITNTPRHYTRLFLMDTSGWLGSTTLPYTQNINGASPPNNARLMLVSTIAQALPNIGTRPSLAVFNDIWNTQQGAVPNSLSSAGWTGRGDDLLIQRISLDKLFHRLILVNRDPINAAAFSIDTNSPIALGVNSISNAFYLDGTVVGLCNSNGVPMTRYVLTRDIGFVFESDLWQGQIGLDTDANNPSVTGQDFASQAAAFLESNWNSAGNKGQDQQGALLDMYTLMYDYTMWANECPHFNTHGTASAQQPPEWSLLQAVGGQNQLLDTATGKTQGLIK